MAEPIPSQQTQQAIADTSSATVTVVSTDTQVSSHTTMFTLQRFAPKLFNTTISLKITKVSYSYAPPLSGVRVLDLTRIVAGPYCTMILGDLGAEILKIERPGTGDEARKWGPPFIGDSQEACYFIALNRNKKSVCIDIKSDKGRNILYGLAEKADVLVENYVPGKLDELQLGYKDFRERNPRLIYCSISGYGPVGPYKNKPGYDVIAASLGGLLHITGPENGEPVKVGVAITDLATGLYAHGAIMAALIKRAKTGQGQKIDCDLLSTQISTLINIGSNYLNAGKEARRLGTTHESIVPYGAFKTKDGYFTVGSGSDQQFHDFCQRIGMPELAHNPKFASNKLRVENREELLQILRSVFVTKSNSEWKEVFEGSPCPSGAVNNLKETFNDRHVKEIGLVESLNHPVAGEIKVVGHPVKYSEPGVGIQSPPPTLGQHTDCVLQEILNYNVDTINKLREQKIIQ